MVLGPYPGEHEELRGVDGAGGEDDLAGGFDAEALRIAHELHAAHLPRLLVDDDLRHQRVLQHVQVRPVPHRVQESPRGAESRT